MAFWPRTSSGPPGYWLLSLLSSVVSFLWACLDLGIYALWGQFRRSFMQSASNQNQKAIAGQKQQFVNTVWEVVTYDVWGNERDGFEVNAAYRHGTVELRIPVTVNNVGTPREFSSACPTDKQLRQALSLRPIQIETEGDDLTVYVNAARNGYPCGELRCISHASLSPIRPLETK